MKRLNNNVRLSPWLAPLIIKLFRANGVSKDVLAWIAHKLIQKIDNAYAQEAYHELKRRIEQVRH